MTSVLASRPKSCRTCTATRRCGNNCSRLLTWTPELCTVSGVAQFDTMSKPLIAFLAIVHGVRTQPSPSPLPPPPPPCDDCLTEAACSAAATAAELDEGGGGYPFASSTYTVKGCYSYNSGSYAGMAFWGTGGTYAEMTATLSGSKYRVSCPEQCQELPAAPPAPPNPPKYPPSFFRIVPQDSCDADTRANSPRYPYGSQSAAIAACLQEGCTGLGSQVQQISQGQRCLKTRNLEKVGYYMELSQSAGCGGVGFSGWVTNCWNATKCSTDAAAFCRGCSPCGGDGGGGDGGNPSSQLPPPSPSPLMATASMVTAAVVAAGQVSDFTASVQLSLREKVALEMGVAVEAVTLTIEAASVLLTFEVALPASVDADAAKAALATQLADPEAASAFLSTASFVVSVESIEVEPTVGPPPATSSGGNSGSKSVAAGVITILVAAALARKA